MTLEEVFPKDFVHAISGLKISPRRVAPKGRHGEHAAREAGQGLEFRDHRGYVPGDDIRRVDWKLWSRFERLYLQLQDELREHPVYLLVDLSDSAFAEDPPRSLLARRAAAVFAAVALQQSDPVTIYSLGTGLGPSIGPKSGPRALPEVLTRLAALEATGGTDLARCAEEFARQKKRKGLVVWISDFYDPRGLSAVERVLSVIAHRLAMIRLVSPQPLLFGLDGEVLLQDAESGEELLVTLDEDLRRAAETAEAAYAEELQSLCLRRSVPLLALNAAAPLVPQFEPLFAGGVFAP